ncbi:SDR family oxidoreductase [Rhodococcus qingshengii]|uniref:SDR family oxidoreductase n=1 Tax=Rhodococcus qingshengii TaxID=334542 RepID=UPI0024B9CC4C|nr:SDR family oxidoreductase [Rhodococcus qingshengii]MDJ0490928.1 SDR family oxidoreductase [Rhodococcus qingshengii]
MSSLKGKTILISGVARGQGRAHALEIARRGGNVIGLDVCEQIAGIRYPLATENDLAVTVEQVQRTGGRVVADIADVRSQAAIDNVVARGLEEFGAIDGVVANAGTWDLGPKVWETTEESWATVLDVTLSGAWRMVKSAAPHLLKQRSGSIVIISSVNGVEPGPGYTSYVVAKHALLGLMRNTALEMASYNVRCNAICPGVIDTRIWNNEMGWDLFAAGGGEPTRETAIDAVYGFPALSGRSALPAQAITDGVTWLLSDSSEHVTGTKLVIDGGHLIQPGYNPAPQTTGAEADHYRPPADAPE